MIQATILDTMFVEDPEGNQISRSVHLELTDGIDTYLLSAGGFPLTGDLQTLVDAKAETLWSAAEQKGVSGEFLSTLGERKVLIGIIELFVIEINKLRQKTGLPTYTRSQVISALKQVIIDANEV